MTTIFQRNGIPYPPQKFVYKSIYSYYLFNKLIYLRGKYNWLYIPVVKQ
ncbi:unknown protein [Cronobacter turicensis z3032]|uniref:Uncharacterized protein n=1 Tax=Cronobacter turicensis (strain DSM 18703 / CCUG 55852 / LMG 23827 / z3032) TaxID=693216 RepID=C9XVE3_CROTZ|nr:unknown protein [Cronobacter turicensis z3032]